MQVAGYGNVSSVSIIFVYMYTLVTQVWLLGSYIYIYILMEDRVNYDLLDRIEVPS